MAPYQAYDMLQQNGKCIDCKKTLLKEGCNQDEDSSGYIDANEEEQHSGYIK